YSTRIWVGCAGTRVNNRKTKRKSRYHLPAGSGIRAIVCHDRLISEPYWVRESRCPEHHIGLSRSLRSEGSHGNIDETASGGGGIYLRYRHRHYGGNHVRQCAHG